MYNIYFDLIKTYLEDVGTKEEKINFINLHRSVEKYFIKYLRNADYKKLGRNTLIDISCKLDSLCKDVGLETNEVYYSNLKEKVLSK